MNIGRNPTWKPVTAMDRILVSVFTLWFWICYLPLQVLTRIFGWSKINWLVLDILSLPGKILFSIGSLFGENGRYWGKKANAIGHIYFICRMCPASRQSTRDPEGRGLCRWNRRWNEGKFDIEPDFGFSNYFKQYPGSVKLEKFNNLVDKKDV